MFTHLKPKHYAIIAAFIGSLGALVGSLDSYAELAKPSVGGAFLGLCGSFLFALGGEKPRAPYGDRAGDINPNDRRNTPTFNRIVPVLVLAAFALTSCGARSYHIATVSAVGAHASLLETRDAVDANVCGQPTAPPEGVCIPMDARRALAPKLSRGFNLDADTATAIHNWNGVDGEKPNIAQALIDITAIIQDAVDLLPTAAKAKLVTLLNGGAK